MQRQHRRLRSEEVVWVNREIRTVEDVLRMLDRLFTPDADRWTRNASAWWDRFYSDRSRLVPFFVAKPDESLVSYLERGVIAPGRALDLGCGQGAMLSTSPHSV